jgi:hypothetical protein
MSMHWSDLPLKPSSRTLRQFAILWILFLGGLAALNWFVRGNETAAMAFAILAVTLGPAGLAVPAVMRPVFVGLIVLGFPIGWVVSRILLALMFFGLVTPVAWLFRLRGRDILYLKRSAGRETYWLKKPVPPDSASYFRQY